MSIQLEVGKKYKSRNGFVWLCVKDFTEGISMLCKNIDGLSHKECCAFYKDGKYASFRAKTEHEYTLIEEVK